MCAKVEFKRSAGFGTIDPSQIEEFSEISHARVKRRYDSRSVPVHVTEDGTFSCSACEHECAHVRSARDNLPRRLQ